MPDGAHPGTGRPRLPRESHRSVSVRVRFSPSELAQLRLAAAECSLPLATYIRAEALHQRIRPPSVPQVNLRCVGELNRLGNNLNQLLVLIYTNRAPLGLLGTLRALLGLVDEVKGLLLGEARDES